MYVCACRLAGGDPALSDLVRRRDELALWLEQAENAVSSLPVTATDKNLKELKVQQTPKHAQVCISQLALYLSTVISISAPQPVDSAILMVSPDCVAFSFFLLHCTNKSLSVSRSLILGAKPVRPNKHSQN